MLLRSITACALALLLLVFSSIGAPPAGAQSAGPTEDAVSARFREARAAWDAGELARAVPVFEDILEQHIDHPTAPASAQLLLDALHRLQRYQDMERWVERLLARDNPGFAAFVSAHPDLADTLHKLARQLMRKRAEEHERARDHSACARTYREAYNRFPDAPDADELLYNAGVCLEMAGSVGASISMWKSLLQRFPRSPLARRSTTRLARAYDAIAWYEQAAEQYARYARQFAGERDAVAALERAIELRHGLGQADRALELYALFDRQYGRKHAGARERLALLAMDEMFPPGQERAAVAFIEGFLKRSGPRMSREARMVAHARLGELAWQRSCELSARDPARGCVRAVVEDKAAGRCERGPAVRVVTRDRALSDQARRHFQIVLESRAALVGRGDAAGGDADPGLRAAADRAYARTLFYLAEREYEAYLALAFPSGLSFDPRDASRNRESQRRFKVWLAQKQEASTKLVSGGSRPGGYQAVMELGPAAGPWSVAAIARAAQVTNALAEALLHAEIPVDIRRGERVEDQIRVYCDAMKDVTRPLQEQAVQGFIACMRQPLERSGAWYRVCQRALESLRPDEYPGLSERHGAAGHAAPVLDLAPPVLEYPRGR